jgi:hypothetical protein
VGSDILTGGRDLTLAAGARFRGVVVHHVRPAMLGAPKSVTLGTYTTTLRRDTLTTSVLFWDPNEPARSDPQAVVVHNDPAIPHSPPPGFPPTPSLPTGWTAADVPTDQAGASFVSVLTLTP